MSDEEGELFQIQSQFLVIIAIAEIVLDKDGIIKMPDINFEPNPNGLGDELFKVMAKNGDKIAQVSSYKEN